MGARWGWAIDQLCWVDIESSGLVRPDLPLPVLFEVAAVLTDRGLRELGRFTAVIRHADEVLDRLQLAPNVQEMHEENGLIAALRGPEAVSIEAAERALIALLDGCPTPGPVIWGGFSPAAMDRPLLFHYMPRFYERLHYRTLDLSALKLAMRNWGGLETAESSTVHRALPDVLEAIKVANEYRCRLAVGESDEVLALSRR